MKLEMRSSAMSNQAVLTALGDLFWGAVFFCYAWFSPALQYKSWSTYAFVNYGLSIVGIRHLSRSLIGEWLKSLAVTKKEVSEEAV